MDEQSQVTSAEEQKVNMVMALASLQRQMKSGANNFYWIAALSVINSLVTIFGGGMYFVIGLGVTLFIDAVASGIAQELGGSPLVLGLGFLFALVFDVIFVIFAFFAGKGRRWAFITGMVFYALDALVMLAFQEWIGFGFHLYFLWGIWKGYKAFGTLRSLQPQTTADTAFPQDIGV